MKESFYFSHDYSARNDDKILELRSEYGMEGYGIFWAMLETMAENADHCIHRVLIGGLSLSYNLPKAKVIAILNKCLELELFYEVDSCVFSKRMTEHKNRRKALSDAGYEGAKKRWGDGQPIAPPLARKGKERKGKEKKEDILSINIDNNEQALVVQNLVIEHIDKKKPEIDLVINLVKLEVQKSGRLYSAGKNERARAQNLLTAKAFGESAIQAGFNSRSDFIRAIVQLSSETRYAKDINNCETLFYNYAEVYNKGKKQFQEYVEKVEKQEQAGQKSYKI